jgi:hypothetical protein
MAPVICRSWNMYAKKHWCHQSSITCIWCSWNTVNKNSLLYCILFYHYLQYTSTRDILPQIAVDKQWSYTGVWLCLVGKRKVAICYFTLCVIGQCMCHVSEILFLIFLNTYIWWVDRVTGWALCE